VVKKIGYEVEKEAGKADFSTFFVKKMLMRLRICEKSSTFVANYAVSPI
jgi:hypothetical protein